MDLFDGTGIQRHQPGKPLLIRHKADCRKMNIQQLHFNVFQFKKYEFSLQINVITLQRIQKNMLSLKQVQVGRSENHARELAMKSIFIGLEKKIDPLLKE